MKVVQAAAHKCGRMVLLFFPVLLISLYSEAAHSASLTLKIRQLNPDGPVQQVTCTEKSKCVLPVAIHVAQPQNQSVSAQILFVRGSVLITFKTPDGYLYTGEKESADKDAAYETIWHGTVAPSKPSIHNATLFLTAVPNAVVAPILNVAKEAEKKTAHPAVADLEISLEAAP